MRSDSIPPEEGAQWAVRSFVIGTFFFLGLALLMARLVYLMLLSGDDFARRSNANAIKERILYPPRGLILDPTGEVFATTRPRFDCVFLPLGTDPSADSVRARLFARLLGEDPARILELLRAGRKTPFRPVPLVEGLEDEAARLLRVKISERRSELPGLSLEPRPYRHVPMGEAAGHLVGYLSEVTPREIEARGADPARGASQASAGRWRMGDRIGRAGVERALEDDLAGEKGLAVFEVDARGQEIRRLNERPAVPGNEVRLTVRTDLQRVIQADLAGKEGAVVALEPHTGRLLAFYSAPSYDPNIFLDPSRQAERRRMMADTVAKPTYNRALLGSYPPGSTFKVAVVAAAYGEVNPSMRVLCGGSYKGQGCWKKTGHGVMWMLPGLVNSCDVYFYRMGEILGIRKIQPVARALGLGIAPGLGFGPEGTSLVPTPEWERENVRTPDGGHWGEGDDRNTAIGQGYVLVTPLELARMMGTVGAGGRRYRLQYIEEVRDPEGRVLRRFAPVLEEDLAWDEEKKRFLLGALDGVVQWGTGGRARLAGIRVGGKTGTAQTPHGKDHAWFVALAPIEDPHIAVAVFVAHGEHGSSAAAPIARDVIETWAKATGHWTETPPPRIRRRARRAEEAPAADASPAPSGEESPE